MSKDTTAIDLEKKYKPLIIILSIAIPLVVAALGGIKIEGYNTSYLPPIYASINGITAILLISAVISIKNGNRQRHELLMKFAIACSALFLIGYVVYHATSTSTEYGGTGLSKYIYYTILISHIFLSIAIIPLVLFTYVKAWAGNFEGHKKMARITFPIWLYVAITGVVVFLMINPYYGA